MDRPTYQVVVSHPSGIHVACWTGLGFSLVEAEADATRRASEDPRTSGLDLSQLRRDAYVASAWEKVLAVPSYTCECPAAERSLYVVRGPHRIRVVVSYCDDCAAEARAEADDGETATIELVPATAAFATEEDAVEGAKVSVAQRQEREVRRGQ